MKKTTIEIYVDDSWADESNSTTESYSNISDITDFIVKYLDNLNTMIEDLK